MDEEAGWNDGQGLFPGHKLRGLKRRDWGQPSRRFLEEEITPAEEDDVDDTAPQVFAPSCRSYWGNEISIVDSGIEVCFPCDGVNGATFTDLPGSFTVTYDSDLGYWISPNDGEWLALEGEECETTVGTGFFFATAVCEEVVDEETEEVSFVLTVRIYAKVTIGGDDFQYLIYVGDFTEPDTVANGQNCGDSGAFAGEGSVTI